MKGSMLLSLVTLCVVMLLVADRISLFLHGPEPVPAAVEPPTPEIDWTALWRGLSGLFQGRPDSGEQHSGPGESVVITEDTLYRAWVWSGPDGELRSTSLDPGNGLARQVWIPRGMTVEEFFAPVAAARTPKPEDSGNTDPQDASPDARPDMEELTRMADSLADGDAMTPEEHRRFIREGVRLFREQQQQRAAR